MSPPLSGRGFVSTQYGRQVHPDQTKAVKGQYSKTLVTAGAIKRPLPCPVEEVEKQRAHFTTLKEKQSKRKSKKKKDKNENRVGKKENQERKKRVSSKSMHQ